jgi:uncharacterized protein (TIGR02186 family)
MKAHLLMIFGFFLTCMQAQAESLIVSLSSERIRINSNFTGAELTLFGAVERDVATIARSGNYDAVVTVRGPRGSVTIREKKALGPLWLNRVQRRYIAIPAFISVLSNRPLPQIAAEEMRRKMRIGIDPLVPPQGARSSFADHDEPDFREALIRIRRSQGLFRENDQSVRFLNSSLFRSNIRIPGIAPLGNYDVDVALFADNIQLAKASASFVVTKSGAEQAVAAAAREQPFAYGVLTAGLALLIGWLASVIFRRD